ncbi:hypothetical protein VTN77DRAFT_4501 [Rasamsonia byssochlamydoides]|uniref:uncharacterized protein n=1 Tax=Rasamsonia byssochlamydoides TaxID=89139 RepID=UPI003742D1C1
MASGSQSGSAATGRKRSHSSSRPARNVQSSNRRATRALTRLKTRNNAHLTVEDPVVPNPSVTTPRKPRKKVRFSDPGPQLNSMAESDSTGLTPALLRTSFDESIPDPEEPEMRTPSRRARRQSAPLPETTKILDPAFPIEKTTTPARVYQFTPLRQLLDQRTQRRIRRVGLSDEINKIEREKRAAAKREQAREAELAALKRELEAVRAEKEANTLISDGETTLSTFHRIEKLEAELRRLREEASACADQGINDGNGEEDTIMTDDMMTVSTSPVLRAQDQSDHLLALDTSLSDDEQPVTMDASIQVSMPDPSQEAEMRSLSRDLEAARKEKLNLFNEWKAQITSTSYGSTCSSRASSPPPDFMSQIVPTLKAALTRASDACHELDTVRRELSDMGFSGSNLDEIIAGVRHSFRSARIELERAVPGETANASLNNGHATLTALVKRVKHLVQDLQGERRRHSNLLSQEKALRSQFDTCLLRYEAASKKIQQLEETIDTNAGDMLHARMRIQELESEAKEKDIGIDRLNAALDKYHNEVKSLEAIVSKLESENASLKSSYTQQISDLESKVAAEQDGRHAAELLAFEREKSIAELEEVVQQNRIRVCDLIAKVECLEKERKEVVESMEQKAAQEVGSLNVRLSELTTALEAAKLEIDKLRRKNSGLEDRIYMETEARERLIHNILEAINAEGRSAKVRTANWKLKSDELESEPLLPGSEPISPVRASTNKFANVQIGRGKNRRKRLDSGIGILTEESDINENNDDGCQVEPSSDFDVAGPVPKSDADVVDAD